jgi:beta-glucosidase
LDDFPEGFVFGAATSSYQIEGAVDANGRGESIWDQFSHTPGKTDEGATGDVAVDHYRRYREDIELLARAGLDAYRFSISWPRVYPRGWGSINRAGLDFYDRLVDLLLERNIAPWACLFHWDLPRRVQSLGGWSTRDTVGRFSDYSLTVAERLADRVRFWMPVNEPSIFAILGHLVGLHAPGIRDLDQCVAAAHHLNLGTAAAADALRSVRNDLEIGNALALNWIEPTSDSGSDVDAAVRRDAFMNRAFLDPLFKGSYPEEVEELFRPWILDDDLDRMSGRLDFIGVNYYTRLRVAARKGAKLLDTTMTPVDRQAEVTAMGWEVFPQGLTLQLERLHEELAHVPLYITENGAAFDDEPGPDGRVDDPRRINFIQRHLASCQEALEAGVDLRGYFVWSLLDNFEWAEGYSKRFGIVRVDYDTLERIPKASYDWLRGLVR